MRYLTRRPHPSLEPYVECLWLLEDSASAGLQEPEHVLPDGKTELIIHFGDRFERLASDDGFELQARSLFAGQSTRRLVLRGVGKIGMVAARFKARGSSRIVRFQRFIALAQDGRPLRLTDAALACGYYDQAHFIRDFRAFSGTSPSSFLRKTHSLNALFSSVP